MTSTTSPTTTPTEGPKPKAIGSASFSFSLTERYTIERTDDAVLLFLGNARLFLTEEGARVLGHRLVKAADRGVGGLS